ncbi:hypothetical protein [Corynebacterium sp. H78]|uniref:hypothetical protein n=1 Tax=Corynebacterium sp. H78 TaxID=3133417 RepID=UPI0030957048
MKRRSTQSASALTALIFASLTLAACGAQDPAESKEAPVATSESAAVSTNPDAPEMSKEESEREGGYNFIRTEDDGSTTVLSHVVVLSDDNWYGIAEEQGQYTELAKGTYKVVARGASGCGGAGTKSDEGLGVIGEIHVKDKGSADVWSTPAKIDADSFTTVTLIDEEDKIVACAKAVSWTAPSTSATTSTSTSSN